MINLLLISCTNYFRFLPKGCKRYLCWFFLYPQILDSSELDGLIQEIEKEKEEEAEKKKKK